MEKAKAPKVFSLGKECPMCGQKTYLRMTEEEENKWRKYACFGGHIQDRFPDMDVQKREFIKSGYCSLNLSFTMSIFRFLSFLFLFSDY